LALRIEIEALAIALELPRGFADLHGSLFGERHHRRKLRVDCRHRAQRLKSSADTRMSVAVLILIERGERHLRCLCETPAIHEPCALLRQPRDFPVLELQRLELADLVLQQLELRLAVASAAFELEGALEHLAPDAIGDSDLVDQRTQPAIDVEQLTLRGGTGERLEFVLAVDVDEDAAGLAQQLHRNGLAVELGAGAPVGREDAADDELIVRVDRLLLEPAGEAGPRLAEIEGGG